MLSGTNSGVQAIPQSPLWDQAMASVWLKPHPSLPLPLSPVSQECAREKQLAQNPCLRLFYET